MKHFYKLLAIIILMIAINGCETDEICLEEITPHLVIRFYNKNIPDEYRSVLLLKVKIEGIDGSYENETITDFTDSITLPLVVTENKTQYILTLTGNESQGIEDNLDTISLVYLQEDIFVSRSCGYKTIYRHAEISLTEDDDNWIKFLEATRYPLDIIDENLAHVKIYH